MPSRPLPGTLAELIADAIALEGESASRFRENAAYLRAAGYGNLASVLAKLEAIERAHVEALRRCLEHGLAELRPIEQPQAIAARDPRALSLQELPRNVCEALALALAAERRAETYYREVAANAASPLVRGMAADLAAGEHRHVRVVERLLADAACA